MSERRDRKEILELASNYLLLDRCIGGHIVHSHYCCMWCGSSDPSSTKEGICWKEKIRGSEHNPDDYTDSEKRRIVRRFKVYGA